MNATDQSLGAGNESPVDLTPVQQGWAWHALADCIAHQARAIADGVSDPGDVERLDADVARLVATKHHRLGGDPS